MTEKIIAEIYSRFGVKMTCVKDRVGTQTEIVQEGENTTFAFSFKNARYLGTIPVGNEMGKSIALLLTSYFENRDDLQADLSKAERLKGILLGETSPAGTYRFMAKYSVKTEPCFVLVVKSNRLLDETVAILDQYEENERGEVVKMTEELCAIVKANLLDRPGRLRKPGPRVGCFEF